MVVVHPKNRLGQIYFDFNRSRLDFLAIDILSRNQHALPAGTIRMISARSIHRALPFMLNMVLLTSSALADEVTFAENAQEIPSQVDPDFQPKGGIEYKLTGSHLFRPNPEQNPGPASIETSRAWSNANEFVYRTALANDLVLPAMSAGLLENGWYSVGFKIKNGKSRVEILVHLEKKLIKLR
jgi:hypothetical protein